MVIKSRRTQHYGENYDYRTRQLSEDTPIPHGTLVIWKFRTKN